MQASIIKVEVKAVSSYGLEVFKVYVNNTYATEFLSSNLAMVYVMRHYPNALIV